MGILWRPLMFFGLLLAMPLLGTVPSSKAQKIYDDPSYSFVQNATELPTLVPKAYDFIVIGGGTTGCPIATTLSHHFKVLLLERGGLPYGNPLVEKEELFYPNLQIDTPTSTSQSFVSEDGVPNQRARVLGGGSSINAGFFTKPDLKFIIESGWNYSLVESSFDWVADRVAQFPSLKVFQTAARDALLDAGVTPNNNQTYEHLIGTKVGGSLFDDNGRRHSAADLLVDANPDNLDVVMWANVQKILFIGSDRRAEGVVFKDLYGMSHTVLLQDEKSEVIVSAGALGSPQLLMLSGIGPPTHLAQFNITCIYKNNFVGSHMADNPTNAFWVLTNKKVEVSLIQVVGITKFGSYIEVSSGTAQVVLDFLRNIPAYVNNIATYSKMVKISAQALQARIIAAIFSTPPKYQDQATYGGNILQKITGPCSKGWLRLASLDPNVNPKVRFNYFKQKIDLDICVQGVRTVLKALNATPLLSLQYTNETVPNELRLIKDTIESTWPQRVFGNIIEDYENISQWCKNTVQTIWHYHGGCLIGKVVDRNYRVYGVKSLRVIDGSTFWRSPGTNPQGTLMMLGRYMGLKILHERLGYEVDT